MTRRTRNMLQDQFKQGKMPTEENFADLISSMLNMLDEGFDKTPEAGFKVAQLRDGKLMSFYKDINIGNPLWSFGLDKSNDNLSILDARNQPLLTLSGITGADGIHRSAIGIRQNQPQHELDVAGCIASYGRVGHSGDFSVPADGNWYDITDTMTGCQAWEIMAGVGANDSEGRYALTHAVALNAFNGSGTIEHQQTHFGNKCSRIELRWLSEDAKKPFEFKLQMRVGCSYGDDVWIKYHMTQLWLDTLMLESGQKPLLQPVPQYDAKGKVKK